MKLFENKVGRPTNEILKKRRTFYLATLLMAVFLVGTCCLLFSINQVSKLRGVVLDDLLHFDEDYLYLSAKASKGKYNSSTDKYELPLKISWRKKNEKFYIESKWKIYNTSGDNVCVGDFGDLSKKYYYTGTYNLNIPAGCIKPSTKYKLVLTYNALRASNGKLYLENHNWKKNEWFKTNQFIRKTTTTKPANKTIKLSSISKNGITITTTKLSNTSVTFNVSSSSYLKSCTLYKNANSKLTKVKRYPNASANYSNKKSITISISGLAKNTNYRFECANGNIATLNFKTPN